MIYLVVTRYGSLHSLYLHEEDARTNARAVRGVLVAMPIIEDFRGQ
jgi:hypothetical protein